MYLCNDRWEIVINEIDYNPESADNFVRPDEYIVICDDYSIRTYFLPSSGKKYFDRQ